MRWISRCTDTYTLHTYYKYNDEQYMRMKLDVAACTYILGKRECVYWSRRAFMHYMLYIVHTRAMWWALVRLHTLSLNVSFLSLRSFCVASNRFDCSSLSRSLTVCQFPVYYILVRTYHTHTNTHKHMDNKQRTTNTPTHNWQCRIGWMHPENRVKLPTQHTALGSFNQRLSLSIQISTSYSFIFISYMQQAVHT